MNTQKEITAWANETFGESTVWYLYQRLYMEHDEFSCAIGENPNEDKLQVVDELADLYIVGVQIAEKLGIDLMERVSEKMEKNKARKWAKDPEDGMWKHVK